jgi:hypothetical protein
MLIKIRDETDNRASIVLACMAVLPVLALLVATCK